MKKNMKKILVLLVLTIFTTAATITVPDERGYVTVNITEYKELAPDTAELSIVIETYDTKSMQKASADNKEIADKVYAALKSMIAPGDVIKTANFSATPEYKDGLNNRRVLDRYRVNNNIVVRTKSIEKVGAMIDKSIELGAKNVGNLTFSVSKYDSECESLLTAASQKAYAQAQAAAKPAMLAGVKSMNLSCSANSTNNPLKPVYRSKGLSTGEANYSVDSVTVIEAGILRLNANVNAAYFVK